LTDTKPRLTDNSPAVALTYPTQVIFWTNFLAVFLVSGVIFGFPALAARLRTRGQYSELCGDADDNDNDDDNHISGDDGDNNNEETCQEQTFKFTLLSVVPTFVFFLCLFLSGATVDSIGPKCASTIGGLLATLGFFLLALSDSAHFDAFMPALLLITAGMFEFMLLPPSLTLLIPIGVHSCCIVCCIVYQKCTKTNKTILMACLFSYSGSILMK